MVGSAGSIDTKHPLYAEKLKSWEQMLHTYGGQRLIKDQGQKYLPATGGMVLDGLGVGQRGLAAYDSYKERALFPDLIRSAIATHLGLMHREDAVIELPEKLDPMRRIASARGESLQTLLRRINFNQLLLGRFGLLLEVPTGGGPNTLPFIATYAASNIINWDDGIREDGEQAFNLVVLQESEFERSTFQWEFISKHRVLQLNEAGIYQVAISRDNNTPSDADFIAPAIAGTELDFIPFVVVNTEDTLSDPDEPSFLGLSDLSLAIYRLEADYRHTLFMQSQETLVVIGAEEGDDGEIQRIGAGARLDLPLDGDAKYIGTSGEGLAEQRQAIENDKKLALQQGSRLLDSGGQDRQSGEALRVRVQAKTPTLTGISDAGASALEQSLRQAAIWVGADPDEVSIKPNKDFVEDTLIGRDLVELMTAKQLGAPLSERSLHALMKRKDLTRMEFDDEKDLIADEDPVAIPPSAAQRGGISVVADPEAPGGIVSRTSGSDD